MIDFVVHDAEGLILRSGRAPDEATAALQAVLPGESVVVGQGGRRDLHHVVDGAVFERPPMPTFAKTTFLADGSDEAAVWGVPDGTLIEVNGIPLPPLLGGVLSLFAYLPGTFEVRMTRWPYRDYEETIVAL